MNRWVVEVHPKLIPEWYPERGRLMLPARVRIVVKQTDPAAFPDLAHGI